jgi:hypothetical protein
MLMEHQAFMPRLVNELIEALEGLDIPHPSSHFAIYSLKNSTRKMLLLSKKPLTNDVLNDAWGEYPRQDFRFAVQLFPAADSIKDNLYNQMVLNGWQSMRDYAKVDISPCDDNRPFIAQMGLWRNLDFEKMDRIAGYSDWLGFPLSNIVTVIILIVVIVLIVPLNFLPYLTGGEKLRAAPWLYFFLIGMAFMSVEIILIQKYTLLIGPSVYSVITILFVLLLSSGIGSRFSPKINPNTVFAAIVLWILLDITVFSSLIYMAGGLALFPRILLTAILIVPLGFFMGMPFPKAAVRVGPLVDWGFAVNGTASVLGSTLIVMVAFSVGINIALIIGACLYSIAFLMFRLDKAW